MPALSYIILVMIFMCFPIAFCVLYGICMLVFLNILVMCLVCFPMYVKVACFACTETFPDDEQFSSKHVRGFK